MPLKLNSTNGSITISAEDGSGNANVSVPRAGFGSVSSLSDLSITATATELNYVDGVTSAIQTQIDTKAPLASPALTGTPTAPTATAGDSSTKIATTAFVGTEVSNLVDSAPSTLNTLNELAAALGDDANFSTTVTNSIAAKLPLAGGTMTGALAVNNISISGNTISTTDTDGNLIITPNGTGNVNINTDTLAISGAESESAALVLNADEADDNADTWRIASNTGNTLSIENQISGSSINHVTITPDATVANSTLAAAGKITDRDGDVRAIPQSGSDKTSSYTLTTGDIGNFVGIGSGGSITVPNSTFSAGDAISIFNNTSGDRTITCSITTAYIGGEDADKASVTLATRGVCTILFISGTVCVITGNVS
jgi:hypothetical protein